VVFGHGGWLAGRIVRSRRELIRQLEARNRELEAEREQFACESVRYERARIARELHDIVAHSLSLIVVQAGAGQRLVDVDQEAAADALRAIAQAAGSARAETSRLADLSGDEAYTRASLGLASVDELVCRARAVGVHVTSRTLVSGDVLAPAASHAAYRVIQEALTNALRHAPGAQVEITVSEAGGRVAVNVENGPPPDSSPGPDWPGAGRGLAGLKDRVAACGGSLTVGPTPSGGWLVQAELPAAIA
jgi:signal transduction histidine kinase